MTLLTALPKKPAQKRQGRWSSSSTTDGGPSSPVATSRPRRILVTRSPCFALRGSRSTTLSGSVATASSEKPVTPQLSRGRLSNNLYVAAPENPRWEIGHHTDDLARRDALESLLGALSQSKEQTMARDRFPTWPSVSVEEIAVAYRERASLEKWIADHAPPDAVLQLADTSFGAVDSDERVRTRAQGDVTNSDAAKRRLAAWAVRHQAEIEMWSELEHELRRHEYRLGQAAAYSQPEHTVALLGPLPEHISGAERWQFAAGVIEAYRVRWNVTDADALGPEPVDPEQHAHWQRALSALGSAGLAEPCGPGEGPDEAWVSSLWDRVHALDDERHEPRDVTSVSEQAHLAWSRSVHDGQGFDGGLGI